jgi:tetraacyldisaccharide 4'-kinase
LIERRDLIEGTLEALDANVIIMDDGFQNPSLVKDFSLIVVDGVSGIGNACVFPAGPLRAPLSFQMARADAVLIIGGHPGMEKKMLPALNKRMPIFNAALHPQWANDKPMPSGPVVAFCGIGRPQKFFETLRASGLEAVETVSFPDHHKFTEADAEWLLTLAQKHKAALITTEKDHVRLSGGHGKRSVLKEAAHAFPVTLRFAHDDESRLMSLISAVLPAAVRESA